MCNCAGILSNKSVCILCHLYECTWNKSFPYVSVGSKFPNSFVSSSRLTGKKHVIDMCNLHMQNVRIHLCVCKDITFS